MPRTIRLDAARPVASLLEALSWTPYALAKALTPDGDAVHVSRAQRLLRPEGGIRLATLVRDLGALGYEVEIVARQKK